jgi:hypothetical protein
MLAKGTHGDSGGSRVTAPKREVAQLSAAACE